MIYVSKIVSKIITMYINKWYKKNFFFLFIDGFLKETKERTIYEEQNQPRI